MRTRPAAFASELYWMQTWSYSTPVLLLLDGNQIELISDFRVELSCAASELDVHVSRGIMTVNHRDSSYRLTAFAGRTSPPPLEKMQRRLADFRAAHPGMPRESILHTIRQWRDYLLAAGASVHGPSAAADDTP